ncbi:proliferating cell nuclear antigen (pcna) [Candidatus Micrarchaeota archaeon]|nr:proliferating cell nuclear antigen (pcna) [Candidatus Micrarchaeota archaeon]
MKLVVEDAPILKAAIDSIVSLVEEGEFELKHDGLHLKAMDPSQISMVSFIMPKSAFSEYSIPEEMRIGMNMTQLSNVLSRGKKGEKAELGMEDGRLVLKFYADKRKKTFKVPLIEASEKPQREPKIEFKSQVSIRADAFKEALKDARLVSSHVRLILDPKEFIVEVKGDSGDVREQFEVGGSEVVEIKTENGARATFPLQYLEDMMKATSGSSTVTLHLETDKPLKLEYEMEGAKVTYYLAPRIETD